MTTQEFKKAFDLAKRRKSHGEIPDTDIGMFSGFALRDFRPVTVTLEQVARLIRWQAQMFNGDWDAEQLGIIREAGRKGFIIAG